MNSRLIVYNLIVAYSSLKGEGYNAKVYISSLRENGHMQAANPTSQTPAAELHIRSSSMSPQPNIYSFALLYNIQRSLNP